MYNMICVQYVALIISLMISKSYPLAFKKNIKPIRFDNNQQKNTNQWVPSNIEEMEGFYEYMNTRQVKEQAPIVYKKLKKEEKLERYINKPFKPHK